MKNILIAVIVLALIGGGIYFFGKKEAVAPEVNLESTENTNGQVNNGNENTNTVSGTVNTGAINVEVQPPIVTTQPTVITKTFTINGNNFAFDVKTMEVSKGDKVKIIFKNTSGKHDWKIDEFNAATKILNGGEEETIEFIADKTGSFEYYCSVGSHRAMGMKGNLIVK